MSSRQSSIKLLGVLMVVTSAFVLILYAYMYQKMLLLLSGLLSADRYISETNQMIIGIIFSLSLVLIAGTGVYLSRSPDMAGLRRIHRIFTRVFFCIEGSNHPSPILFNTLPLIIGGFLVVNIFSMVNHKQVYERLYFEDGLFESITPILVFISCILLFNAIRRLQSTPTIVPHSKWLLRFYWLFLLAIFFYAMEEISWGQRIIGWATPESFNLNSQNETNLHNFFNGWYGWIYPSLSLFAVLPLLSLFSELSGRWLALGRLVFPHPSLFGIGMMVAFIALAFPQEQELIEELLTVAIFFYCLRLNCCYCGVRGCIDTSTRLN